MLFQSALQPAVPLGMIGFAADPRVLGTVSEAAATRTLSLGAPCAPPFTVHTRFLILIGGSGAQQWPLGEQPGGSALCRAPDLQVSFSPHQVNTPRHDSSWCPN